MSSTEIHKLTIDNEISIYVSKRDDGLLIRAISIGDEVIYTDEETKNMLEGGSRVKDEA